MNVQGDIFHRSTRNREEYVLKLQDKDAFDTCNTV